MNSKNIEAAYPLSPMQQGMLFHTIYALESGMYFVQLSCTIDGNLNALAFQRAWQRLVERHPVLRTAFVWDKIEKPLQVVGRRVSLLWEQLDWRGLSPVEQQEQLEAFLQADRKRGFQLSKAPLMRLTLIQVNKDVYQFILSFHHLLLDGWSLSLVLKEVFAFYEAFCQGQDLHLERSRPYQSYIAWLQQQDLTEAEAFWRLTLKGFSTPTSVGVDQVLGSLSSEGESYDEQQIQLSVAVTTALQSFARQHQLTLNTLVQGAWALLLSRYSGQEDVVFGATFSGRPADLAGVESMVGLFINTLPIRVQVSPQAFLLGWLEQIQAQQVELRQYEYSSLVQVQGWSDVPRGLPLFESLVVFENYPVGTSLQKQGGSLEIHNFRGVDRTNYPLTVAAVPGAELSLELSYDCRRFDRITITRMLGHFQTLLEGIITAPQQRLVDLPMLTQPERQQLLVEWNDTQVDYPQDICIHQLFEAQVERTPDAVAVVFECQQLTYRQLNRRANKIAHHLCSLGIGRDTLVGICVERSLEMIVGLLGILKAGGAYVPLDPAYPKDRLAYILNDSQVSVLVTTETLVAGLPEHQARVVCLDKDCEINPTESEETPVIGVKADNLAYVIYTSGSTGKPKGVAITHRNLVNAYFAWEDAYQLRTSCTNHLQMASFSFDVFSGDLVRALCSGAKLVISPREGLLEPEKLYKLMRNEQVDCAEFVPAVLRNLIQYLERTQQNLSFMRLLIVGSDSWLVKEYQQFQRFCGTQTRLINSYGASEATIDSSYFESAVVTLSIDELVPIGRPFANTKIYILDPHLQPVPIGVAGELHIGGAGLARGYLNQPELTEQKFIPNPFSNESGDRLYKTGDLGRYLPDGTIEFLGRLDNQVKIRGFRIELGEIEAVLSQHPAVQETVVMVREDVSGNKRLVAYLVVNQLAAPTIPELQQFLKQKLPEYMVPSAFVLLEVLPLTPNGKVDRRALPAPDTSCLSLEASFVSPRDTLELQLVQIWEEVLNVHPVGIRDNFFDLGGHSLLAITLMARIQQKFGKNLPLATLFQGATIEHLASLLRQQTDSLSWSTLIAIQPNGPKRPLFCLHPGGGTVLSYTNLACHLDPQRPFYGLESLGLDEEQKPYAQIEDMAAYYIEAMQAVQPQGPYLLAGWSFGGLVAFEMAQQLQARDQQVSFLGLLDISAVPEASEELQELDDVAFLIKLLAEDISLSLEHIRQLEPDEQLLYLIEQARQFNLIPPDLGLVEVRRLLQIFTSHIQAAKTYIPQPYPGRVTLFRASEGAVADSQDLTLGWEELATEGVDLHWVPGDHHTMVVEPHVQVLAKQLRACLEQSQTNDGGNGDGSTP
jgi:amino acid adenylation domain-containing protein